MAGHRKIKNNKTQKRKHNKKRKQCNMEGYQKKIRKIQKTKIWYPTRRKMNSNIKQKNGNIKKNIMKIMQWNAGHKKWSNKVTEIQALVDQYDPEVCYITEANMGNETPDHDKVIQGYTLEYPLTRENPELNYSRIVALVKNGVTTKVMTNHMSKDISSIWLQIIRKGPKKLVVGGVYREHRFLNQQDDSSGTQAAQLSRWNKATQQWLEAGRGNDCIVMGDCNVDAIKWDQGQTTPFTDIMDNNIIAQGFTQHIVGPTRFWPGCADTLIDHGWVNCPQKLVGHRNIDRAMSDHNVTELTISSTKKILNEQEILIRTKMKITDDEFCTKLENQDWISMYNTDNPDVAYSVLENNIRRVLDAEAPIKKIQPRRKNKEWVTKETKNEMIIRDEMRKQAVRTKLDSDWTNYRTKRNTCAFLVKKDKKKNILH